MSDDLRTYLDAVLGDTVGRLHIAVGSGPHLNEDGKYKHKHWVQSHFAWPDESELAAREMLRAALDSDVYVCPYLMWKDKRAKGAAVAHRLVHTDIDHGSIDTDRVRAVDGFAVASGSQGHAHVYIALAEEVTAPQHRTLCVALGNYLGGADPKITDNDVLRPPGTLNYKPTTAGGEPAPVQWLVPPSNIRVDPSALAHTLGVTLPATTSVANTAAVTVEEVDLAGHPRVQAALAKDTGDRSADTMRVVGACRDDGLTLAQTRHVIGTRPNLAARLTERQDDDVLTCWLKAIDSRQQRSTATCGVAVAHDGEQSTPATTALTTVVADKHSGQVRIAYRLADHYRDRLLYVHGLGWQLWDGTRWAPDDAGHAKRAVLDVLRTALAESLDDKELRADVRKCESASGVAGVLDLAGALPEFAATVRDLDADPYLFNTAGGTLDLRTMEMRGHEPADRITKVTRAAYDPDAPGSTWDRHLTRVLPGTEVRDYLQRLTGVALVGKVLEHVLGILTGTGANGKSVFINALAWALGDYASTAEPDLFMHREGAHPTGEMDLLGRRLVVVSESERDRRLAEATMKRLTGGDIIRARKMRQDFIEFEPSHTALLVTNHLPKVAGDDPAIWRRLRVIPFGVEIPAAERDPRIGEALQAEADAVLAWAVGGWVAYRQQDGLAEPAAVIAATDKYHQASDAIGRFVAEACVTNSPVVKATTGQLFEVWEKWRQVDGAEPISQKAFGQALDRLGFPAGQPANGKRWRTGIALLAVSDDQ